MTILAPEICRTLDIRNYLMFTHTGDDDMTYADLFELPFGIFAFSYDEDDSFDEDFEDDDFDDEESFDGEDEDEGYDW